MGEIKACSHSKGGADWFSVGEVMSGCVCVRERELRERSDSVVGVKQAKTA